MITFDKTPALTRCFHDLSLSMISMQEFLRKLLPYMEKPLTEKEEKDVLLLFSQYGVPQHSLKISPKLLKNHPYFRNIQLKEIQTETVSYKETVIPKRRLMNTDFMKPLGRHLFHYHPLGYFEEDIRMPALHEGDTVWMAPAVSEFTSMEEGIRKGHGKCLTFGLGIGLIVYMWLRKEEVTEVTIVEFNEDVIQLFQKHILPQFPEGKSVTIIHGDAFDYSTENFLSQFDYVYVDFWESTEDGLTYYTKLMETGVDLPHVDFWIEESILMDVKYLTFLYLKHVFEGKSASDFMFQQDFSLAKYARKIHFFFQQLEMTIGSPEELLSLIHSRNVLRSILSI